MVCGFFMSEKKRASSSAHRVRALVDRVTANGGRRLTILLSPEANAATEALVASGYAPSATATICRALVETAQGGAPAPQAPLLPPSLERAVEHLLGCGYADSVPAAIARALTDAARVRGFS